MAFGERVIFVFRLLIRYYLVKRNNLLLFLFYTFIAFILQIKNADIIYVLPFQLLSFLPLLYLFKEDALLNSFYYVLSLGKIEIHSGKLPIFFFLLTFQDLFLNYNESLYLHFVTALSLFISMITNLNFFFINRGWIKILLILIIFFLIKSVIVFYGLIIGLVIFALSSLFTVYNIRHEYNGYF